MKPSEIESEFIIEMWGAGSGGGLVGGDSTVGGMAAGVDPELLRVLGDLIRKKYRNQRKRLRMRLPDQPDRVSAILNAILAVKAVAAVNY